MVFFLVRYAIFFVNFIFAILLIVDKKIGKTFETIDPRTGEVIARISEGTKEDIDVAVKAARYAFDSGPWPRLPGTVCYFSSLLLFFI
jgi:hypothetical protein